MGRGRSGPMEQSMKKPKWDKKGKNFHMLKAVDVCYEEKIFFKEQFIEELKKMNPQNFMNILLQNQCEQGH